MIEFQNGIHIKGTNFWLDARKKVDFSFISHAHIDHAVRHKEILTTKETARLYEHRFGKAKFNILEYNQPRRFDSAQTGGRLTAYLKTHHPFGSKFEKSKSKGGIKVELFPSGHILGGAQILLEIERVRIVYTGDFKLRKCLTAKKAEIKKCDILIMESTFGLPHYIFPDRKEIIDQITEFVDQALSFGQVPIFLAYSLGKAQEIMKILGNQGYKTSVHQAIFKIAKIYEEFGVKFKNYEHYSAKGKSTSGRQAEDLEGKVLIVPLYVRGSRMIDKIPKKRVAILTGWAIDSGCKDWFGVDEAFPLSDHADFSELMEYAKLAEPQKIYTVHGFPEFSDFLRKEGFDAEPLKESTKVTKTFGKELLLNYDLFMRD